MESIAELSRRTRNVCPSDIIALLERAEEQRDIVQHIDERLTKSKQSMEYVVTKCNKNIFDQPFN